ncbi:hypothetical protein ABPG75_013803 [Micractinium tetrahymenae]
MLPGDVDRACLGASCKELHAASPRWFPQISTWMSPGEEDVAQSLAAWLQRYRVPAELDLVARLEIERGGARPSIGCVLHVLSRSAAATACIKVLTGGDMLAVRPALLPSFAALRRLELAPSCHLEGNVQPLWQPTGLQVLALPGCFSERHYSSTEGSWDGLSRLSALRELRLDDCVHAEAVISQLSALTALTALQLATFVDEPVDGDEAPGLSPTCQWCNFTGLCQLRSLHLAYLEHDPPMTEHPFMRQLSALAGSLQRLHLGAFQVDTIPAELSSCTALSELDIRGAESDYPGAITGKGLKALAGLTRLETLMLTACWLWDSATSLAPLASLTRLELREVFELGRGALFYQGLSVLRRLRQLSFDGCCQVWGFQAFSVLTALTYLSNTGPEEGCDPEGVGTLTQLRELALMDRWLKEVPKDLTTLPALMRLDLSENPIGMAGWKRLRRLQSLASLDVRKCRLVAVPSSFSRLQGLTHLSLRATISLLDFAYLVPW